MVNKPPLVSDIASPGFHALLTTVRQVCPGGLPLPRQVIIAAGSKYFATIAGNIYRYPLIGLGSDGTG